MILDRLTKIITSLRLTVILLAFAIILVFVGTVAQADEGLFNAQSRYFKQWLVMGITMFGTKVPVILPGGYLLGSMLILNLIASHIYRFQLTWKKLGIHIAHGGIILLLVGQLATDLFSRESQIRFYEGQTRSYSESPSNYELVFVTSADAKDNEEVTIPAAMLSKGAEVKNPNLPFAIHVQQYWRNSDASFRAPMLTNGPALTTNGIATSFDFRPREESKSMDDPNVPSAILDLIGPAGSLGEWVVSAWAGDESASQGLKKIYARQTGPQMAERIVSHLVEPQSIHINGRKFTFTLRPRRIYNPFSLTLVKATHSVYRGTVTDANPEGIPKDFRSRIRLRNQKTGEDRELEIYMNSPLRYDGLTFYQYQMGAGDLAQQQGMVPYSVLQVVKNPGWLTPYVGCSLVALGLVIQFGSHLIKFVSRKRIA